MKAELILGLITMVIGAIFGGKLWGAKKYKKGYTEGRVDQVDELERASEASRGAIAIVDNIAEEEAAAARQKASQELSRLRGRKPTPAEVESFLNEAHRN